MSHSLILQKLLEENSIDVVIKLWHLSTLNAWVFLPSSFSFCFMQTYNTYSWGSITFAAREPGKWMAPIFNICHGRQGGSALMKKGEGNCCWGRQLIWPAVTRELLQVRSWVEKNLSLAMEKSLLSWIGWWLPPWAWCHVHTCGLVFRMETVIFPISLVLLLWLRASFVLWCENSSCDLALSFIDCPIF